MDIELLKAVVEQIKEDAEDGDYTAIEDLLKDILDKNKVETMYSSDSNNYVKVIRTKEVEELLQELQFNEDNHNKKLEAQDG